LASSDLDWDSIFQKRPDLSPPGYQEAAKQARLDSITRYESQGRKRAGKSGKTKGNVFPGMKHASQD
jgi:hypothetical protein